MKKHKTGTYFQYCNLKSNYYYIILSKKTALELGDNEPIIVCDDEYVFEIAEMDKVL